MNNCHAVLLDTISIQNYIFQSSKLKENLGASHLVREIYHNYLARALCEVTGRTFKAELQDLNDWKKSDSNNPDCSKPVDIAYIGGGNALLFFQNSKDAHRFIEEWTKILLIYAPGLTTAVADDAFPQNPKNFQSCLKRLFFLLENNKGKHSPISSLPRHGITAECARSGVSAEVYNDLIGNYVSAGVNARIEAAAESKKEFEERYSKLLGQTYCFSDELDDLGGIEGEDSHIAIVHIDGNDIGEYFRRADGLEKIRKLSVDIDNATQVAFDSIIETIVGRYDDIMLSLGFDISLDARERRCPTEHVLTDGAFSNLAQKKNFPINFLKNLHRLKNREYGSEKKFIRAFEDELKKKLSREKFQFTDQQQNQLITEAKKRKILPIRPIILGGDDVTFVCDGKLGIYFAKIFIERFQQTKINGKSLTACAGVAIIKTKYPFYRGYWLSDELCKDAKRKRKRNSQWSESSVLDFHVSLSGISGSLDKIRQQYYGRDDSPDRKGTQVDLLYRPFKIIPKDSIDEFSLDMFLEKARQLDDEETGLPKNKRHELREVLKLPEFARCEYVRALKYRGRSLPEIKGLKYHVALVDNNITPYFDMIEILRFYPEFALKEIGKAL